MEVNIYSEKQKSVWDDFVRNSKNGTFLFQRDFMDYHSDRFEDLSLLFNKADRCVALLPGNLRDGVFYSHQGLTYGGLIMNNDTKASDVLEIFDLLISFLREKGVSEILYKPVPHIYHRTPAEEDLYALFLHRAELVGRGISSTLSLTVDGAGYSKSRISGLKKAEKAGLYVKQSDDLESFWTILSDNLVKRYASDPVHNFQEMRLLKNLFPDNIKLYGVFTPRHEMIGGELVFLSANVSHAQYTAATDEGKNSGAIDLAIDHVIGEARKAGKQYFDYGISTENNGLYLNNGLVSQKEGFGARGIVYDIYSIKLS